MSSSRQLLRPARAISRSTQVTVSRRLSTRSIIVPISASTKPSPSLGQRIAPFSTTSYRAKGLQPDSSDPEPPQTESHHGDEAGPGAAQISDAEYHEIADQYLNTLVLALEEHAESTSEGIEAEFSAGVLTISHPNHGTYVLNKQPPNRQVWLSSPISGPKRFDWVIMSDSQQHKSESTIDTGDDGSTGGKWIYLRDGSSLSDILRKELGVKISPGGEEDAISGQEGPGKGGVTSAS